MTTLFLERNIAVRAHPLSSTSYTTRGGNKVSRSRLPVSLRQCPDWPSATTCGHHRWDWALPHGSRKQQTHSTQLCSITVNSSDWTKARFTPRRAHNRDRFPTPREACKSSWNPRGILNSFTLTIPWHSAKLVKISPGIIARLHHIDRRPMLLQKEQCAE